MSGTRPPDRAARARALDPARSFVVQAPAGAGKTELLTQRLLRLLCVVDRPEEILAITFTRKAAAEMRQRVLAALAGVDGAAPADRNAGGPGTAPSPDPDPAPEDESAALTRALAARARAHDAQRGWALLAHPARLQVHTIDAFCLALSRGLPLCAELGALPDIEERPGALYREAARRTLEGTSTLTAAWEVLLGHVDTNVERALDLLARMLSRREQWLPHLGAGGGAPVRERLEGWLDEAQRQALGRARRTLPPELGARLLGLVAEVAGDLGPDSPLRALAGLDALPEAEPSALDRWRALVDWVLTGTGEVRTALKGEQGFPASASRKGAAREALVARKARMTEALDALRAHPEAVAGLAAIRVLPPSRYAPRQWRMLEALLELLPHAAAQLKLVFAERGRADFAEFAEGALRALGTPDAPADLLLALDYRIHHVLIDEFQDTSGVQYDLLERLTAGWTQGDGRTLFLVGDPMQSIYRFRQAEVRLFLRARNEGVGGVVPEPLGLVANFRSRPALVEWANRCFARCFPAHEDFASGAVPFSPSVATRPVDPEAGVTARLFASREEEAQWVAQRVAELRADRPQASVAILVRARSHLGEILPALAARGLRWTGLDLDPLAQRQATLDLLALARALLRPADRLAWLAVLRAPWCGIGLPDLTRLVDGAGDEPVPALLADPDRTARLGKEARRRLARVGPVLARACAERGRVPVHLLASRAWHALGGPATLEDEGGIADADQVFRRLADLEEAGDIADIVRLDVALADLFAAPDARADPRLVVTTMHKAKGLQFDHVLLPRLDAGRGRDDPPLLAWRSLPRAADGSALFLAPLAARGGERDALYDWVRGALAEEQGLELARLAYVAATRARETLVLTAALAAPPEDRPKSPPAGSMLEVFWRGAAEDFRRQPDAGASGSAGAATRGATPVGHGVLRRLPADWSPPSRPVLSWQAREAPAARGPRPEFTWARETARVVGVLVHRWLLRIARDGVARWDAARLRAAEPAMRVRLAELGLPAAQIEQGAARALAALEATISDARGRWVLDAGHAQARSEWALSGVRDGVPIDVVVDRSFVDGTGTRWVIDYKTGTHEGGAAEAFLDSEVERYRARMEAYAGLVSALGPEPVRVALYFPLLRGWRAWSPGEGGGGPVAVSPL